MLPAFEMSAQRRRTGVPMLLAQPVLYYNTSTAPLVLVHLISTLILCSIGLLTLQDAYITLHVIAIHNEQTPLYQTYISTYIACSCTQRPTRGGGHGALGLIPGQRLYTGWR